MVARSSSESGSARKRRFSFMRIAFWIATGFLALLILAGLFTQTGIFRSWLCGMIVSTANESLTGEVSIGELDGNLFTNVTLSDISVVLENDTILSVKTVHARYDITALWSGTVRIDSVTVDSVYCLASQAEDSSWNFEHLVPGDTGTPSEETANQSSGYDIVLQDFALTRVSADIEGFNEIIPRRLVDLGLHLTATYEQDRQRVEIHELHLATAQPEVRITDCRLGASVDTTAIMLRELMLATVGNRIEASGIFYPKAATRNSAQIVVSPISLDEFKAFLPQDIPDIKGDMTFNASLENDTMTVRCAVAQAIDRLDLTASASPVSSILDSVSQQVLQYKAELNLQNIAGKHWLPDPPLDFLLNGTLAIKGTGIDPQLAEVNLVADLSGSRVERHTVNELSFDVSFGQGDATGSLSTAGVFGRAQVTGDISDILDSPKYDLVADLKNIDLGQVQLNDSLESDINAHMKLSGVGSSLETAAGKIDLTLAPSRIMWLDIDVARVLASFSADEVDIDTLNVVTSSAAVVVSGSLNNGKEGLINCVVNVNDTSMLAGYLGVNNVRLKGRIEGVLSGNMERQHIDAAYEFEEIAYEDITVGATGGNVIVDLADSTIDAKGKIFVKAVKSGDVLLDSASVSGEFTVDSAAVEASVWHSLLESQIKTVVEFDSVTTLVLDDLAFTYDAQRWSLDKPGATIEVDTARYAVQDLQMSSAEDRQQTIRIDGVLDLHQESDITVAADNIDLTPLGSLAEQEIEGSLSIGATLTGTLQQPVVAGHFDISDARVFQYDIRRVAGELSFADSLCSFLLNLKTTANDSMRISGTVPVLLDSGQVSVDGNRPVRINVMLDSLPLSVLEIGDGLVEEADGFIDCNLTVSQTLQNPTIVGTMSVNNGHVVAPKYGVKYDGIQVGLSFQPNRIAIDSVTMRRDKGKFRLSGGLDYDSSLIAGRIRSSRIDLVTKKFFVVRHRDYEVQLTSNVGVSGTDSAATYSGTIAVDRSRFYLPALIGDMGESPLDDAGLPLLVIATEEPSTDSSHTDAIAGSASSPDSLAADLMRRLSGHLKITIPKNTWIKSPELSLELAGDLEIVQEGREPELFGDIRVVRGHYDLYGRRFKVQRGVVSFDGGSYLDPSLDIETLYVLRTPTREKKKLQLLITGTAQVPVIAFSLDGVAILEGDAVSYIVFGRSLDELSQSQQSTLGGESGTKKMVGGVAAKMLAGQLAGALGRKLNMDVMEIKAGGDLESAAIVVGKYLTPDLFMSYQRSFGASTNDDLEPELVTLEYQLTRLIFLQLTEGDAEEAGFDVILKFEKD